MVSESYVKVDSYSRFALLELELFDLELLELLDFELSDLELSESEPEPALLDSRVLDPDSVSVGVVSPRSDLSLDS